MRTAEAKRAYIKAYRARVSKPCAECSTGTAVGNSAICPACVYKRRAADRVCERCGKGFRGRLTGGRPVCNSCRSTPSQKATRSNQARLRRARRFSTAIETADLSLSWRTLWAEGLRECQYCGAYCDPGDLSYGTVGPHHPTLDHVVSLVAGGAHTRSNSVLSCHRCNTKKGTSAWKETP